MTDHEHENLKTTRVLLSANTTMSMVMDNDTSEEPKGGLSSRQLTDAFHAIIKQKAIYYPVSYRLVREIGRGRQGVVFLALRHGARGCLTRHAIKLFDPGIYPEVKKYWTDMGRLAAQTSHIQPIHSPSLVSREIYDETNGVGYLQMELVEGMNLEEFIRSDHLERVRKYASSEEWERFTDVIFRIEDDAVRIQPGVAMYLMRQALRGLESLHAMGFLHSDVKPANIMLDRLGYAKLIDFGRANRINEHVSFLLGTPLYMAPEIHRRRPGGSQSDLYSLGLVGLELLRGKPFVDDHGMTEESLLEFKLNLKDRIPDLLPEDVRENDKLVSIMQQLLDPDPTRRYPDAREAESGQEGLHLIHKQLMLAGKDTAYGRELENYLSKIVPKVDHLEAVDDQA